jgi:hypothetical protein
MKYQEAMKDGKFQVGEELMAWSCPSERRSLVVDRDLFPKADTTWKSGQLRTIYDSPTVHAGQRSRPGNGRRR